MNVAENAARELRKSTAFPQILSTHFGTAEEIADALEFAVQWWGQAKAGALWASYTQTQSNRSWNYTLALIDRLRASFQAVAATDPSVRKGAAELHPAHRGEIGGGSAKAVVTRRRIA